ncbi:reverse transcriptase domain-containing protein [Tanacetum coccineum]
MARKSVNFSRNITTLFAFMLVPHQAPEGEGSAIPHGSQPTPSTSQPIVSGPQIESLQIETPPTAAPQTEVFQAVVSQISPSPTTYQRTRKTHKRRRTKKDTELPQTSVPLDHGADEAVHKEGGIETGGSPRRQETTGGTMAQVRPEGAPIQSSDPSLSPVNIGASGEDRIEHTFELTDLNVPPTPNALPLSPVNIGGSEGGEPLTLKELTDVCTNLATRVLALETTKAAQAKEIKNLKLRVRALESKKRARLPVCWVLIISTIVPRTPPTTQTFFDDEDVTMAMAQTLMKLKSKEKDKGKGILKESPMKKLKRSDFDKAQIESDAELAKRLLEEENEVDALFAAKLQEEERDQYTIEERARFLQETIAAKKKFFAEQRTTFIRNKPPTRTRLRSIMMTFLKHQGNYKHHQLKGKSFEEIQVLYEKEKRFIDNFVPMGSAEEERIAPERSKKKRKVGSRVKSMSKRQRVSQEVADSDSEYEKKKEELSLHLKIASNEDKEVDYEILDVRSPIIDIDVIDEILEEDFDALLDKGSKILHSIEGTILKLAVLVLLDVYKIVMERYEHDIPEGFDRVLWGDLMILYAFICLKKRSFAITIPDTANEFAIKGNHLTLVKGNQFDGRTETDLHKHIHEFLRICDMFKYRDTVNEAVCLMMFPLSLTGEAKTWLDELNEGTITTWDELRTASISQFFPPALFDRLLGEIRAFSQHENETLTDAWLSLNATTGGIFLYKTPKQAYQLLEDKVLLKLDWAKNQKTKSSLKKTVAFADKGSSNSDTDKYYGPNGCHDHENGCSIQRNEISNIYGLQKPTRSYNQNHQASIQNLEAKFDRFADKQSARPSGSLPSNTQPNPKVNPTDQQNDSEAHITFNSDDEEEESTPQIKPQTPKPVKETLIPKPYKTKIPYPQRLRKEKMEAQYGKFLDMIRVVRINVPRVNVLAGMPNYGKFLKELVNNKHKLEQISSAFLSDESSAMIQNKVPLKLGDPRSFLIPCTFSKAFSCNALADLGASINLMSYSLYAKLSLETLKPTKISVRLVNRSFQYPIGIAENMLVEVGKFTFPVDFIILEMEEDSKVPLILRRPFLHTADVVIQVKQKQLNLRVGTERMIFHIDYAMKHSYSNDDTCFSIDVIDEILKEDFDALLDEGSKISTIPSKEPSSKKKSLLNSMNSWQ